MRRAAPLLLALAVLAGCGVGSGGDEKDERAQRTGTPAAPAQKAPPVGRAEIEEHLRALQQIADRNGGNRATGTAGERETIAYVAGRLRDAGWRVRTQPVSFPFFEIESPPRLDGLRRGRDFRVLRYSGSGRVRARIRPLDTRACTHAALSPVRRGEIALVARGTCTFARKARSAQRAGAAALLVADSSAQAPVSATLGRPGAARIPVLTVRADAAARLARAGRPVEVRVDATSEQRRTRNVLAETAAGPSRVVMAGAHLDSVPAGPGINDNASGVAALLEVAERLRDRPGLRLGFWAAEEIGLYGSRAYVRRLSRAERGRIAAYVNLDMVGSPKPEPAVYDTDDRIERELREAFPGDEGERAVHEDSDHAPFARAGIPVGGLFTGASRATDPCYHRACDTFGNVDAEMAARMANATAQVLPRLAG